MNRLQVGLIGAGVMGRFHGATLATLPGVRLVAVTDSDMARAAEAARELDCACLHPDDLLSDGAIDAVVIASPASTHALLIEQVVRAGKAVFCEKPLAVDLEEALNVVELVERNGTPFQIGFQRRFDPGVERLKELAGSGELGTLETFHSITADPRGPDFAAMQRAAGIFHDTMSHDVDMALLFFGRVAEVRAWGDACLDPRFLELGKPDTTAVFLRFESGRLGTIENRLRTGYGYETSLAVGGSRGKGVVRDDHADRLTLYLHGSVSRSHVDWFLERYRDAYRLEIEAFVAAVLRGKQPEPGARHALEVQLVCRAAELSYLEDRPVQIAEVRETARLA